MGIPGDGGAAGADWPPSSRVSACRFLRSVISSPYLRCGVISLFFAWIAQGWRTTRRLLAVGLPISMQMVLEVSAFALTLIMMGWIGTVPLAAHQVVLSLSNIVYMVVVGISAATTIMVSHRYGAGDYRGDAPGRTGFLALGIVANLLTMACFVAFRRFFAGTLYFGPGGHRGGCSTVFDGRAIPDSRRIADDRPRCTTRNAGCAHHDVLRFLSRISSSTCR